VTYKLALPLGATIHPVFHVSLLKKAVPATEQDIEAIPDATVAFQIPEQVLQYRLTPGGSSQTEVLIKWTDMPSSLATWEKLDCLKQQFPKAPTLEHAGSFPGAGGVSTTTLPGDGPVEENQDVDIDEPRKSSRIRKPNVRVAGPEWSKPM
jgi:hypothetical protein